MTIVVIGVLRVNIVSEDLVSLFSACNLPVQ